MNAVLEPSLIFASDEEWEDEEKQDQFLENMMNLLDYIDSHEDIRIYWNDELEIALWEDPNLPPWRLDKDLKNRLVPILHKVFHENLENLDTDPDLEPCKMEPNLKYYKENESVVNLFLKLMHNVLTITDGIYLCVNKVNNQQFKISCECHKKIIEPTVVTKISDFIDIDEFLDLNWPQTKEDDYRIREIIDTINEIQNNTMLYEYKFGDDFVKDLTSVRERRKKIITQIIKRLTLSSEEARRDGTLQDEYIQQVGTYRFRVTSGSSALRIHYEYTKDKEIKFLRYYDEGQHDDGLRAK